MDSSSFTFVIFQAVSPKQWTAWVYLFNLFRAVSPKQWTVWAYLHFPKSVIPCFVRKRDVTQSFASLSNSIPRFVGTRNINVHSPVYRNTEYQCSFPGLSEYGISSFIPRLAGLRKFTQIQFSQVSSPMCLVQRCHQSNVCFYKPSVYKYISKIPQMSIQDFISFHTAINTVVDNHFPQ